MRKINIQEAQKYMLDILCDVSRICEENNISYWLDGGTLLGAVRQNDFIPWDDDIDICMPRNDYNKFIKIAQDKLNSRFFLQTDETEEDYCIKTVPCKVRMNDSYVDENIYYELGLESVNFHRGIFIDIFPVDNYSDTRLSKIKYSLFSILYFIKSVSYFNKYKNRKVFFLSRLFKYIPYSIFNKLKDIIINDINKKDLDKVTYGVECVIYNNVFFKRDVFPLKKMEFSGCFFYVPNNVDGYLKALYGVDYMIPPSSENLHFHCDSIYVEIKKDN